MLRIEQLQQILEVERLGSISKAAESLLIAQPALSRSISALERELDTKIFVRTSKGVTATDSGKDVLKVARAILNEVNRLYRIERDDSILVGSINIVVVSAIYSTLYSKLILPCRTRYPGLNPVVTSEGFDKALKRIAAGEFDIGVVYEPTVCDRSTKRAINEMHANRELICENIGIERVNAFISKASPLASKDIVDLRELSDIPLIVKREADLAAIGFNDPDYIIVDDDWQTIKLVAENQGYVIAASSLYLGRSELLNDMIKQVPIRDFDEYCAVSLVYKKRFATTSLIDFLKEVVQGAL